MDGASNSKIYESVKTVAICAMCFIILIASFSLLTLAHSIIPESITLANMEKSLAILDEEGVYPSAGTVFGIEKFEGFAGQGNRIDNYTNMWMIQGADSTHWFDEEEYRERKPYDSQRREAIEGGAFSRALLSGWDHGEYWSGYRIAFKPLMVITDVWGIRILQIALLLLSLIWACVRVSQSLGHIEAFLLAAAVLLVNPLNIMLSFGQAPDMIQALLSIVTVLWMHKRRVSARWFTVYFMTLGMVEAFFNCLIMPLITLGFPLIALTLAKMKTSAGEGPRISRIASLCIAWGFGYAGTFISVWIITALATDSSIKAAILQGIAEFSFRSGGQDNSLIENMLLAIQNNINLNTPFLWIIVVLAIIAIRKTSRTNEGKKHIRNYFALIAISLLPFLWIIVLNNHSMIHSWMAHDIFAISVWSLCCLIYYLAHSYWGTRDNERI